jgi:PAS domain S-box-containing protein
LSGAELPGTLAFGMKRKDGTHADVLAQGALAFFLGRPAVIGVIIDVTEQKRVEASLRLSEAQLSNALAIARAAHWEYDVARDQFIFNDNFYRIFHTTAEQVGGYTMSSADYARRFVYPDEIGLVAREVQASIATNDCNYISELEHRIICADGAIGYVALRISVVKDTTGRTVRAFGVSQDITERKRNEETLRQVNRALRLLSTADAVLV